MLTCDFRGASPLVYKKFQSLQSNGLNVGLSCEFSLTEGSDFWRASLSMASRSIGCVKCSTVVYAGVRAAFIRTDVEILVPRLRSPSGYRSGGCVRRRAFPDACSVVGRPSAPPR